MDEEHELICKGIAHYEDIIEKKFNGTFVLTPEVVMAMKKIRSIQSLCVHEFDDNGLCIYCHYQNPQEAE